MTSSLLNDFLRLHDEFVSRERIRTNLLDWATDVLAPMGLVPGAHHRFLLKHLDLVASGGIRRLMVLMPPGSAKSTYTSIIFPIWWFMRHPVSSVIAASHTAALVEHFSRRMHALIQENRHKIGFQLHTDDRSASHWRTDAGGEYFAAGVRGAITGRRADLAIIDDPVKSMAEADSERHRRHVWEWYTADLMTRLKPDARVVLVMTRWHEDDLGGQLLSRNGEDWHVLRLPAIAETADPIGRPPGAPLWPEWEDLEALNRKRALVGDRVWSALFQQSPRPPGGHLFRVEHLRAVDTSQAVALPVIQAVRAWDLAATPASGSGHHDPDWSVGLKLALLEGGRYLIQDVVRLREDAGTVEAAIVAAARSDGHSVVVSLPIDPGQAGKSQAARLSSMLAGHRIYTSREQGSKPVRAAPVAAQIEAGNVMIHKTFWHQAFMDELRSFPQGTKDDQVDALSRAFTTLSDLRNSGRRLSVPFNVR